MNIVKKILIVLLLLGVLTVSWIAVAGSGKDDTEEQNQLIEEAQEYIDDKIYVYSIPLLEKAINISSEKTYEIQVLLKDIYLKMGETKKYAALLETIVLSESASADIFFETANYKFNKRSYKEALELLLKGFEQTDDDRLIDYYEEKRYAISKVSSRYQYISEIFDGTVIVKNIDKWGIASKNGSIIIPCIYDKVSTYHNGRVVVSKDSEIYAVNSKNQRVAVLKKEIDDFGNLSDEILSLLINDKWVKSKPNTPEFQINDAEYEWLGAFSNGYSAVKINGKFGVISKNGEWLVPAEYEEIKTDEFGRCLFQNAVFVKQNGLYYLYNSDGRHDTAYEDARGFNSKVLDTPYAAVKKDGKWGFIDNTGKEVLPFEWDEALSFGMHLAAVKIGDMWGYISRAGKIVIEPKYLEAKSFYDGYAPVLNETGWSFIVLNEYK